MIDKKYVILHGHFYQPPRENPWTGIIDRQASAFPFPDWNTRINQECYTATGRTSVIENNQVIAMVNCYEYLSFNFGPTLLEWMEREGHHKTIELLIEADKISRIRNSGHGNAIAQVYNHLIMPLASEKDQYTQAIWGLEDFKNRFGRHSEGIWLSETAINNETASILVDNGVKFVILSPYQAQKIIKTNQQFNVLGGSVDTSKPYRLHTKNGDLQVFFYHGGLASEISFGNVLSSSSSLKDAFLGALNQQNQDIKLLNIATDGEVYGHHKSFANLSLARLIYENMLPGNNYFEFTNYAKFLADFPPTDECELYLGDDGKGSSWSCAHGLGRWERDCSCHTGGGDHWNQLWRKPLREAFDYLRDCIIDVSLKYTNGRLKDLWQARNDFFHVISDQQSFDKFILAHQSRELNTEEVQQIFKIMQGLRYAMLMYTSCGWFFSDVSGIETLQDLIYAQKAYEYLEDLLPPDIYTKYLQILSKAESNVSGNGQQILEQTLQSYCITKEQLLEYNLWTFIRDLKIDRFLLESLSACKVVFQDFEKNRYLIHFRFPFQNDQYVSFYLEKSGDISPIDRVFWTYSETLATEDELIQDSYWSFLDGVSILSQLPPSLKMHFVLCGVVFETEQLYTPYGNKNSYLQEVLDQSQILCPNELKILQHYFISQIYLFSEFLKYNHLDELIVRTFLNNIIFLEKSVNAYHEMVNYLDPVFKGMEVFLSSILARGDEEDFSLFNKIYWSVKSFIPIFYNDLFRDMIFKYYKRELNLNESNDSLFLGKIKKMLVDLGFLNIK
ncbi:MAG: DUF3536 domain-containing protein [Brevinema sp.]